MHATHSYQFRPTIIVLDGKAGMTTGISHAADGRTIYDILCGFLEHQKVSLYQGIGIIAVRENDVATPLPIRVGEQNFFPPYDVKSIPENPTFKQLFDAALVAVQSERVRQNIAHDGFEIPESRVQVLYVSQTDAEQLPRHMADMREVLSTGNRWAHLDHVFIGYLLVDPNKGIITPINAPLLSIDYTAPLQPGETKAASPTSPTLPQIPVPPWAMTLLPQITTLNGKEIKVPPLVNFCFIYSELMAESAPTFATPPDITYAMAEAIFTLTATPMSLTGLFQRSTQRSLRLDTYDERIGSLSTSMIRFPRNEVAGFSARLLGADLLVSLIHALGHEKLDASAREQKVEEAKSFANLIRDWMVDHDDPVRLGTEDVTDLAWPSMSTLGATQRGYARQLRLHNACEALFRPCRPEVARTPDDKPLELAAILQIVGNAGTALDHYTTAAESAWSYFGRLIRRHFWREIDQLWLRPNGNIELARVYVAEFEKHLQDMSADNVKLREDHKNAFQQKLARYHRLAGDPAAPWNQHVAPSSGQRQQDITFNSILLSLIARRDYLTAEKVNPLSLYVAEGLALPFIYLLASYALFAAPFTSFVITGALLVLSGGVIAGISWGYQQWLDRRVKKAELDIYQFIQYYLGYICEDVEDAMRATMLDPTMRAVRTVSDRLRDIEKYFLARSRSLRQEAEIIENELFNGAANYRDVLVANGRQLDHTTHTLQMVYARIREIQEQHPIEPWHHKIETMRSTLQEVLLAFTNAMSAAIDEIDDDQLKEALETSQSVLSRSNEELESIIINFAATINQPYLRGDIANIARALRHDPSGAMWLSAMGKARTLYPAYIQTFAHLFSAGILENRQAVPHHVKPPELIELDTSSPEWLLIARFWGGGGQSYWISDTASSAEKEPAHATIHNTRGQ